MSISLSGDTAELLEFLAESPRKIYSSAFVLIGVEAVGRATITALKINRPALVRLCKLWYELGEHPPR